MKSARLLIPVLLVMLLSGCNKTNERTPVPISVTYELVAADPNAQFAITYNGNNGIVATTAGNGWSRSVTGDRPFAASVTAAINTNTAFQFSVRILYRGVLRKENTGTTVPGVNTTLSVSETFDR